MAAPRIVAVIPALDEEDAIGSVVRAMPPLVAETIVADNGSRDRTAAAAREAGARVVVEPCRGYGNACLAGIAAAGRRGRAPLPRRRWQRRPRAGGRRRRADPRGPRRPRDRLAQPRPPRAWRAAVARDPRHEGVRGPAEPALGRAGHRPRAVPRDPRRRAAPPRDGRPQLRLDGRDAGQGGARRPARRRGARRPPPAGGRAQQGERDRARHDRRGHEDRRHDPAPRVATARPRGLRDRALGRRPRLGTRPAAAFGDRAAPRSLRRGLRRVPRRAPRLARAVAAGARRRARRWRVAWRAILVPVPPLLSNDINRYVWEGRVQVHGGNPYRWADRPDAPRWVELRDGVWDGLNHKDYTAVYPPLFLLATRAVVARPRLDHRDEGVPRPVRDRRVGGARRAAAASPAAARASPRARVEPARPRRDRRQRPQRGVRHPVARARAPRARGRPAAPVRARRRRGLHVEVPAGARRRRVGATVPVVARARRGRSLALARPAVPERPTHDAAEPVEVRRVLDVQRDAVRAARRAPRPHRRGARRRRCSRCCSRSSSRGGGPSRSPRPRPSSRPRCCSARTCCRGTRCGSCPCWSFATSLRRCSSPAPSRSRTSSTRAGSRASAGGCRWPWRALEYLPCAVVAVVGWRRRPPAAPAGSGSS